MNIQQLEQYTHKLLFDCTNEEIYEALVHLINEKKEHIPSLSFFLLLPSSEAGDRWAPG